MSTTNPTETRSATPTSSSHPNRHDATANASSSQPPAHTHTPAGSSNTVLSNAASWKLGSTTDCILELGVRNCSERYFRTWLARLPAKVSAAVAESAVAVLEPGDNVRLMCQLPGARHAAAAGSGTLGLRSSSTSLFNVGSNNKTAGAGLSTAASSSSISREMLPTQMSADITTTVDLSSTFLPAREEPNRMRCAERLTEELAVCWEMITGDVAPDKLLRGMVRLSPVDVARALTPGRYSYSWLWC